LHTDQKFEFEDRYKEAKAIEKTNAYGIMEGSYLTVKVIDARNLKSMTENESSDPYAIISIEGQKEETNFIDATQNCKFDVKTGKDNLEILILDRDLYNADNFEGRLILNLNEFKDQMKVDKWYDLQSTNAKEKWQGEIRVETQWIHSRIRFFEDLLARLDQILDQDQKERVQIEEYLRDLRAPFGFLEYLDYGHFEIDEVDQAKKAANGNLGAQINLMEKRMAVTIDELADGMGIRQPPWYRWLVWLTLVYVFLTL
jgi:hypothetical protein